MISGGVVTNFRNETCTRIIDGRQNSYEIYYGQYLDTLAPYAFDAMKILLESIISLSQNKNITPCNTRFYRQALAIELRNTSVQGITGLVEFDTSLDRKGGGTYDVWNHNGSTWLQIMSFSQERTPKISFNAPFVMSTAPIWPLGDPGLANAPVSADPVDTTRHRYAWHRSIFPSLAAVLTCCVLAASIMTFTFRNNRLIKAASPNLLQVMNLGHIFLLTVIFVGFPSPSDGSCVCEVGNYKNHLIRKNAEHLCRLCLDTSGLQ